jgi:hypothetical protein
MYAALIRAAERWRGIRIGEFEQRQLKAIREEIDKDFATRNAPAATAPQSPLSQQPTDLTRLKVKLLAVMRGPRPTQASIECRLRPTYATRTWF